MSSRIPLVAPGTGDGGSGAPGPHTAAGRGIPREWHTLYDWALVWRYWHGQAEGLRRPHALEIQVLVDLGRGLSDEQLADRLGVQLRQVARWRAKYSGRD